MTTKKQTKVTPKRKLRRRGRLLIVYAIVSFWILSLITLFSIGPVGNVLNEVMQLLVGYLGYVLIVAACCLSFNYLWKMGHFHLSKKSLWAFGLLSLSLSLLLGLSQVATNAPWKAFEALCHALPNFQTGTFSSISGLVGSCLAGLCASLVTNIGAWLIAVGCLMACLVLWIDILTQDDFKDKKSIHEVLEEAQDKILALPMPDFSKLKSLTQMEGPSTWEGVKEVLSEDPTKPKKKPLIALEAPKIEEDLSKTSLAPQLKPEKELEQEPSSEKTKEKAQTNELSSNMPNYDPSHYSTQNIDLSDSLQLQEVHDDFRPSLTSKFMGMDDDPLGYEDEFEAFDYQEAQDVPFEEARKFVDDFQNHTDPLSFADFKRPSNPYALEDNYGGQNSWDEEDSLDFLHQRESLMEGEEFEDSDLSEYDLDQSTFPRSNPTLTSWNRLDGFSNATLVNKLHGAPPFNPNTYTIPSLSLLEEAAPFPYSSTNLRTARKQGKRLIEVLEYFDVEAQLTDLHIGPSVTQFEVLPAPGVSMNSFINLQSDLKTALEAKEIRIQAPLASKDSAGIEVPNLYRDTVYLKDMLRQVPARLHEKPLVFAIGKDVMGNNVYGRLDTMPHLLMAGNEESGRLQGMDALLCSLLLRTTPSEVNLLLIDPTKEELLDYNNVPHLIAPVICEPLMASSALKEVVAKMEERSALFAQIGVRNLSAYNNFIVNQADPTRTKLPRLVVVINELADLMTCASKDVEQSIQRITQDGRAAGIHLVISTARPSINVVTGVVKSNIASRMGYRLDTRLDSRIILDQAGAEKLLGEGDMLWMDNNDPSPRRIQGVLVSEHEVQAVCEAVIKQASPTYDKAFLQLKTEGKHQSEPSDPLYGQVKEFVIAGQRASASLIQRHFRLSFARASRLLDQLEESGVVGPANGSRPRKILIQPSRKSKKNLSSNQDH